MKFTVILDNPTVWNTFRKIEDVLFGLYKKRKVTIRNFGITNTMSVIDIACGTGQYSTITKGEYLGIDLSKKYIESAQKIYGSRNKKFICEDANTAMILDAAYDVALLIDATHHLSNEENKNLLKTLNRVASKAVIICDPITQRRGNLLGRFLTSLDRGSYIRPREKLLQLIGQTLEIERVVDLKIMATENICVLARPKQTSSV